MGFQGESTLDTIPNGKQLLKNPAPVSDPYYGNGELYQLVSQLANSRKKGDFVKVLKGLHWGDSRGILHFNIMLYKNFEQIHASPIHVDVDIMPIIKTPLYYTKKNGDVVINKKYSGVPELVLLRITMM